jgi:hypothetical protein
MGMTSGTLPYVFLFRDPLGHPLGLRVAVSRPRMPHLTFIHGIRFPDGRAAIIGRFT